MSLQTRLDKAAARAVARHGASFDALGRPVQPFYYGTNCYLVPVSSGLVVVWYDDDGRIVGGRKQLTTADELRFVTPPWGRFA